MQLSSPRVRAALGLALAAGLAAVVALLSARGNPPAAARSLVQRPLRDPSLVRRYDLEYDLEDATALSGPGDAGALLDTQATTRLRGIAVVSPVRSPRADAPMWSLRFEPVAASVRLAGRELIPSPDAAQRMFGAALVLVECFPDGAPRRIHERDGDPELARATLRLLAIEIGHARRRDDTWEREETTPQGVLTAHYTWLNDRAALQRDRGAYTRLFAFRARPEHDARATASFSFRGDGALEALTSDETLDVDDPADSSLHRRMHLAMRLTQSAAAEPLRDLSAFVPRAVGAPAEGRSFAQQHLAHRVGEMTVERMIATLMEHRADVRMPNHNEFFWRATGLLVRDPESAGQLVGVFRDATTSRAVRGLVLDMLSRASTPEAQRAMVTLLTSSEAQGDARGYFLQRLGFVKRPVSEVIEAARVACGDPATRDAALYAAGSLARTLRAGDRSEEARSLDAELERAAAHPPPASVRHVLTGLGNAGRDESTPAVVRLARSDDVGTREAGARALSSLQGPRSTEALFAMLDDPSVDVQKLCFRGLKTRTLTVGQVVTLEQRVTSGHFTEAAFGEMSDFWSVQTTSHRAAAVACLQAMIAQDINDGTTRATVFALLDRLRGAS